MGLQVLLDFTSPFTFVSFCTLRIISLAGIHQGNPGWHLLAYFALFFIGNPLSPSFSTPDINAAVANVTVHILVG